MTRSNDTKVHAARSLDGVALFAPAVSSASSAASRLLVPLLVAEAAAFGALALSGKIPESLITALRALLTF
ncbi:MAG: hypothetical protein IPL89_10510 [Acidobacteria bacterium]|nr:hypothetical protein [Acidobacteriota bacterium]MBK9963749.1 hypothetical protein [Holophagales bacterium]